MQQLRFKEFTLLSAEASQDLAKRLEALPPQGGLVHVYDPDTRSLATVSVLNGAIAGWSVYGPLTADEAQYDIKTNQPKQMRMQ